MLKLRRRLASCALALLFCQTAAVFAAPLASGCATRVAAAEEDKDCCPAGSHPPGQCPRHAGSNAASKASCRLQCDSPHGVPFLAGAVGMMPVPVVSAVTIASDRFICSFDPVSLFVARVPHAPPPRLG